MAIDVRAGRDTAVLPQLEGEWSSGSDELAVLDPATGETIAVVSAGDGATVDAAVRKARDAFEEWRWVPPRERGHRLLEAAALIREHADELGALETWEMGKPFEQSRNFDVKLCGDSFEFYGGLADKMSGDTFDLGPISAHTYHEPFGVVGGIIPFNWPPIHFAAKTAPALAAGNAVVLKPPEQDPLTILRLVELLQQVLPPNLVQAVPGFGAETGAALVNHPLVAKVFFTGSPDTARAVMAAAGSRLAPTSTELGGKNALIIFDDADLDLGVYAALEGSFFNQGEACTASSRIFLQEGIAQEFLDRFLPAVPRLTMGDGFDPGIHIGPLVTDVQRDRVAEYLKLGPTEGATVLAEAPIPTDDRLKNGYWVPATVFGDVTPSMTIAREEIFGPATLIFTFKTEEEAVRLANDSPYGLVAGVMGSDAVRLGRVARRLEVGLVMVNNYSRAFLGSPFGGVKESGSGREHAVESILEFTQVKTVRSPSGFGEVPRWQAMEPVIEG